MFTSQPVPQSTNGASDTAAAPTTVTTAEAESVVRAYGTELRQKAEEKRKVESDKNKADGEKFLAENKTKAGVITLPSGLQYKVVTEGKGPKPPGAKNPPGGASAGEANNGSAEPPKPSDGDEPGKQ